MTIGQHIKFNAGIRFIMNLKSNDIYNGTRKTMRFYKVPAVPYRKYQICIMRWLLTSPEKCAFCKEYRIIQTGCTVY